MGTALFLALALMGQAPTTAPPSTSAAAAPTDDYGYVSWCYGALGGYLDLYDKVMPEVTRIEKAFPSPGGVEASLKVYPEMRAQARLDLKTYTAAITAAEKASPRPISEYGRAAINKGRSVWAGSDTTAKARLAQVWMSWSPPGDCETRAKTLERRSNVLGKALIYNAAPAMTPTPEAAAPPAAAPVTPAPIEQTPPPVAETPKPAPVAKPTAKAAMTKAPAAKAPAPKPAAAKTISTPAAKAEIIVDPADPKPCAGRLEPAKRDGKDVLVCRPD